MAETTETKQKATAEEKLPKQEPSPKEQPTEKAKPTAPLPSVEEAAAWEGMRIDGLGGRRSAGSPGFTWTPRTASPAGR